jgi:DNA polymerase
MKKIEKLSGVFPVYVYNENMTAPEKAALAYLFDTMDDYLRDGYRSPHSDYSFTDDIIEENDEPVQEKQTENQVYQIDNNFGELGEEPLEKIALEIKSCTLCGLCEKRTMAVPGEGKSHPLVMVIGEGPGADEDKTGRPFVGKAGQLLDKMLGSIGLYREKNCFIANVVKCRPPNNRDPLPEETSACRDYLSRQISILQPKIILSVGRIPTQILLNTSEGITKLRGHFTEYMGIPFLPTFHPSALLRDENLKRPAWEDLKLLRARLLETDPGYDESKQDKNV